MTYVSFLESPVGMLRILSNGKGITEIKFIDYEGPDDPDIHTEAAKTQLKEYFEGLRDRFDLDLLPDGTRFEQSVWDKLNEIPHGSTCCYSDIAEKLGEPSKAQAVGRANGKNPIAIVIPCHRVIGKNKDLVGYAGGIERKEWLLKHEGALLL
ncbi:methylated-DNA--[protein]-cysteine S-methyltransferase [Balneola sp. MJW-20]|uniref:methylated-DNA--[protein]-cysteine S-methyltransferase n=1 Tax=Gracilimonas aurantiaca TaxID=3234185 RepID=UPI0034662C5A